MWIAPIKYKDKLRLLGNSMALATRLDNLGTETAFAVSLAAAEWGAKGNRIFPFHLGDINLPTSQNIVDAMNKAIADGKTGYCPGAGIPQLREALAANVGGDRGLSFDASNVVVQPGGKPVQILATQFTKAKLNTSAELQSLTVTFQLELGSALIWIKSNL
jgi:aspartate/methionine/tyrosine aminotransferase